MTVSAGTHAFPEYRIHSDLNRQCLPAAERDPERKIAWMNAICLAVLAVGTLMTKEPAEFAFRPEVYESAQPIELPPPPQPTPTETQELRPDEVPDLTTAVQPTVVVVAADPAKVPFAVPVVGATLVSTDLRQVSAPPKLIVPPKIAPPQVFKLSFGQNEKGSFPKMDSYPPEAIARREQGVVVIFLKASAEGGEPTEVSIRESSGSSYLDLAARDYVRRKYRFNPGYAGEYIVPFHFTLPGVGK